MIVFHLYFKNYSRLFRFDFSSPVSQDSQRKVAGEKESSPLTAHLPSYSSGQGLALKRCSSGPMKTDLWSDLTGCGLLMVGVWPHL